MHRELIKSNKMSPTFQITPQIPFLAIEICLVEKSSKIKSVLAKYKNIKKRTTQHENQHKQLCLGCFQYPLNP